jgi:hypothetical protein
MGERATKRASTGRHAGDSREEMPVFVELADGRAGVLPWTALG